MGADPTTSVLNGYCQAHDVKNLFVTDGAPLVTNPDKNPTLTIMALAWRASEYLLDEAKKGKFVESAREKEFHTGAPSARRSQRTKRRKEKRWPRRV